MISSMRKGKQRARQRRVGDKIRVLRHENVPRDQAIAMSLSMERAGRLRRGGKYVRVGKAGKAGRAGRKGSRGRTRSRSRRAS